MRKFTLSAVAVVAIAAVGLVPLTAGASSGTGAVNAPVCLPSAVKGVAHCDAIQLLNPGKNWQGSHGSGTTPGKKPGGGGGTTPSGYNPSDIQTAYGLGPAINGFTTGSQTVAIVDAYNDPNALADLNTYRAKFGIPSCTGTCFKQVNETGGSSLPTGNSSWSEEISLDLDMVSATCPGCNILLVEASSASLADLGAAVDYAAGPGRANVVSNSYGASEYSGEIASDSYYDHPGVVITASAGDSGYGVEYPAASQYVTAVGGTTLTPSTSRRGYTETVWSGTGSGCSAYEPNPGWQPSNACAKRTVADVSADANPSTGVAVYDSYHESGWLVFGGTSVASPIIASVYALAGNAGSASAQGLYSANLNKVTSGTNGSCGNYLCNAADSLNPSGYNGPTGNGTPNGTSGF